MASCEGFERTPFSATFETARARFCLSPPSAQSSRCLRIASCSVELGEGHVNIVRPHELLLTNKHLVLATECDYRGIKLRLHRSTCTPVCSAHTQLPRRPAGSAPAARSRTTRRGSSSTKTLLCALLPSPWLIYPRFFLCTALPSAFAPCGRTAAHHAFRLLFRPRYLFLQIVSAVQHCHHRNIVYRDVKLVNVLLDGSEPPVVQLCDFGVAKRAGGGKDGDIHRLTTFTGTAGFLAPEARTPVKAQQEKRTPIAYRVGQWQHSSFSGGAARHVCPQVIAVGLDRMGATNDGAHAYDGTKSDVWGLGVLLFVMLVHEARAPPPRLPGGAHASPLRLLLTHCPERRDALRS